MCGSESYTEVHRTTVYIVGEVAIWFYDVAAGRLSSRQSPGSFTALDVAGRLYAWFSRRRVSSGAAVTQVGGFRTRPNSRLSRTIPSPAGTLMPVRGLPAIRVVVEPDIYFHGG